MEENSSSDSCLANSSPIQTRSSTSCLSSTSLALIADLVRCYLPILTLVKFKLVSREWRAWCDANLLELAKERRKDEASRDWYFPITFGNHLRNTLTKKWYGIHTWSKLQDLLPDMNFLTNDYFFGLGRSYYEIEAVSSGLLVLSRSSSQDYFYDVIVCNPLSKKWRELPRCHMCRNRIHYVSGKDIHTHLVVDELFNQYKLIQISRWCISIYKSSSDGWVCLPLNMPCPFDPAGFTGCFRGRVYTMSNPDFPVYWRYSLNIHDIESGSHETRVVTLDFQKEFLGEFWRRPGNPILVECMGDLYAVAVSCQARHRGGTLSVKTTFHISKLTTEGEWNVKGSWNRVEVPLEVEVSEPDFADVCRKLREFSCVARSSLICLAPLTWDRDWEYGYLTQYDVVSGLSTTMRSAFAVRGNMYRYDRREKHMAYTPSLDLEP